MRTIIVTPKVKGIGGIAQHTFKLAKKLREKKIKVAVISTHNTKFIKIKSLQNISFSLFSRIKIKELCDRYDVIHGHNLLTGLALDVCKSLPKVLTLHGNYSEQIFMLHGRLAGYFAKALEKKILDKVNVATCISKNTYRYYKKLGFQRLIYIPNAIDLRDLPDSSIRLYERQVIFAGRISKEKGIHILLKAMKYVDRNIHLIVVGSGPLERLVFEASKSFPNIHFIGYKPRDFVLKLMKGSDLLVLPSLHEGLPTVLLEAMALKIPIIATKIPEILDLLSNEEAILVNIDPLELAKAINTYIDSKPLSKVEKAFAKVVKEYNWDIVIDKYIALYKYLTKVYNS